VVIGACAVLLTGAVAAAPSALASAPASSQYQLHLPNAGANGDSTVGTKVGGSGGSSSALPVLVIGAAAIAGGAAALGYFRRRRRAGTA
jgi:hypothetical protein